MKRFSISAALLVSLFLCTTSVAFGQGWVLPAKTPNTPVKCIPCTGASNGQMTVGYSLPIATFTGRYLDSQDTRAYQTTFRTARASIIRIAPDRKRIYMLIGSAIFSYDINTFFARLQAGEIMMPSTQMPVSPPNIRFNPATPEVFLRYDSYFYAEYGSPWTTTLPDGQDRLFGYDWDERGNVYLAYGIFGWGVLHDDPSTTGMMPTLHQHYPSEVVPFRVLELTTTTGQHYLLVSQADNTILVFRVDDPANPQRQADQRRSILEFTKSADGRMVGLVGFNGIELFTSDALAAGGTPLYTRSGSYTNIDTDGTNFFAMSYTNGAAVISVFSPSGGTYLDHQYPTGVPYNTSPKLHFGANYLTVFGYEGSPVFGWNVRLYKLSAPPGRTDPQPTEVSIGNYVAQYYSFASPPGFTHPGFMLANDAVVYKAASKYYLILAMNGLGDVYELKGADTISGQLKSVGYATNPNSVTPPGSGPFYGDGLTFTSSTTAASVVSVNWSFGDGTSVVSNTATPDVQHQYGGLTAADLPATKQASVTSSDLTMSDTVNVTLKKPGVRIGTKNPSLLFKQPDASSPAPIVTSDLFTDASDGALEGHYSEWKFDAGTAVKMLPSDTPSVGGCGAHSLIYTGHYGPYIGSGSALTSTTTDVPFGINPFNYEAKPFVAFIGSPTSDATNVTFSSSSRISGIAADLPGGAATACTYAWELLDSQGLVSPNYSKSGTGVTLGTIPQYVIARSAFSGSLNQKVRLTVSVLPAALNVACQGYPTSIASTGALNAPDPSEIVVSGCAYAGSPCSLSINSVSSASQVDWTYSWSITGSAQSGSGQTFTPPITAAGSYVVTVVINNPFGSSTKQTTFTAAQPPCSSSPTKNNTAIGYSGRTSGCYAPGTVCNTGETITFRAFPSGWTPDICDKYQWSFGDGGQSTDKTPAHVYNVNGTYTVTLKLTGGLSTADNVSTTVNVGYTQPQPTPTPTPGSCDTLTQTNVYVGFYGTTSGCTGSSGSCQTSEPITFSAYYPNCGSPSFAWSFDDGFTSAQRTVAHAFATGGTHTVGLTFYNGSSSIMVSQAVTVNGSGPTPTPTPTPGGCGTITTSNVYVGYYGSKSGCTGASGQDCAANEEISFNLYGNGYAFCGAETYSWNFGDNSQPSTQRTTSHKYAGAGAYPVTMTVNNGSGPVQITATVHVSGGSGGTPSVDANFTFTAGSAANTYTFTPTITPAGVAAKWVWDFGDTDMSTVTSTTPLAKTHVFPGPGTYTVSLSVYDSSDRLLQQVTHTVLVGAARKRSSHH